MNIMNNRILMTVIWLGLMVGSVHAQITSVSGTVRDEMETLIGATVCEVDATGVTSMPQSRISTAISP